MLELKGRLSSVKQKLFQLARLTNRSGKEQFNTSLSTRISTVVCHEPLNSPAYYPLEAKLEKSQALMYRHMLNRTK